MGREIQYGDLEVIQQPGNIIYQQHTSADDTARFRGHEISTAPEQQYLVVLPGNIVLRLNAQTKLKIVRDSTTGNLKTRLIQGEVYVKSQGALVMAGANANIISNGSSFDLRAVGGGSLVAVAEGSLEAQLPSGDQIGLCPDDRSALVKIKENEIIKDTIITDRNVGIEDLIAWKNTERVYEDVSLASFVNDMQYWYGIRFSDLKCLNKEKRITTRLCYKATREDFFCRFLTMLTHHSCLCSPTIPGC